MTPIHRNSHLSLDFGPGIHCWLLFSLLLVTAFSLGGCTNPPAAHNDPFEVTHGSQGTLTTVDSNTVMVATTTPDSLSLTDADIWEWATPPPAGHLTIPELEEYYHQALALVSESQFDQAEDLIFILQDQVMSAVPAESDSLYMMQRCSIERRLILLSGLIAEGRSFASGPAHADSALAAGYAGLLARDFPDSLVPINGESRPPVVADLLQVDNTLVRKWIRYFTGPGRNNFSYWLRRKSASDSLVTTMLESAGLPKELIYLAMIESGLSPHARSDVGAVGPWQFMPGTAKIFDLRNDWWVDERKDLELSTLAACKYLRKLHVQFGDWALVLAAYNSGENRIVRSIRLSGHDNYWRLRLPSQTADFVPKFIAAAKIGQDPERYGFSQEDIVSISYDTVPVDDATDLALIARCADVPKEKVLGLNPALLRRASPPDSRNYPVRVPTGTGSRCQRALRKVPASERLTWRRHKVVRGETLSQIAINYGTTVNDLARLNQLTSVHLIRPGDQLLIPMPARLAAKARQRAQEKGHYVPPDGYVRVSYKVKAGDTLSGIARKLGVSLTHLRKVNGIYKSSLIHPGQRLYAYRPPETRSRGATGTKG